METKKYSDIIGEPGKFGVGEKITLEVVINKEIKVVGFKVMPPAIFEHDWVIVNILDEGVPKYFITGAMVIVDQFKDLLAKKVELPILTTIKNIQGKKHNYNILT